MTSKHPRVLFIIKKFHDYSGYPQISNGLRTSALLVVEMLRSEGYDATLVEAIDGNSIDALVAQYKPDRVVIEAIWVTPDKMAELQRLWPCVEWTVRVHSCLPFLSNEGMAIAWIAAYRNMGIKVGFNSMQAVSDFLTIWDVGYLPNYYPSQPQAVKRHPSFMLNIGCFGAIRPLKNQLIQAFAAISYANDRGMSLTFHMNGSRIEQNGSNNLKNIVALFKAAGQTLELHPWMNHDDFLKLVASMDMCMSVSLSESFCIVAADAVSQGVPFVGSGAIQWLPYEAQAPTDSVSGIVGVMNGAHSFWATRRNRKALEKFSRISISVWKEWMES